MAALDDELADISMELKNKITGSDFKKLQTLHDSQNKLENEYLALMEELEGLSEN